MLVDSPIWSYTPTGESIDGLSDGRITGLIR